MNRYEQITRYEFRPPKYSRIWAPLIYRISEIFYLRRQHKVVEVNVLSGGQMLLEKIKAGDSVLITPNHSDHADPHVLLYINRKYRIPIHFMAARETFEVNYGFNGKVVQRAGVFSIDREGIDLKAIKEAMRIVYEGKYPLVMFPEGEIYHVNEQLTPLNEGAATIMLKTAKRLRKDKQDRGCYIIPTAMRYTYLDDISTTFAEAMDRLEHHLHWTPQQNLDIVKRIYKFGEAFLSLKEKEFLNTELTGDIPDRSNQFRETLISEMEEAYFPKKREGNHPERIRKIRGKIRSILLGEERPSSEEIDNLYNNLDRLYFAIQLYSYPGQYVRDNPSDNRIAETILKFEEDIYGEYRIKGTRKSEVTFCKPINLYDFVDESGKSQKTSVHDITNRIATEIRQVLE